MCVEPALPKEPITFTSHIYLTLLPKTAYCESNRRMFPSLLLLLFCISILLIFSVLSALSCAQFCTRGTIEQMSYTFPMCTCVPEHRCALFDAIMSSGKTFGKMKIYCLKSQPYHEILALDSSLQSCFFVFFPVKATIKMRLVLIYLHKQQQRGVT